MPDQYGIILRADKKTMASLSASDRRSFKLASDAGASSDWWSSMAWLVGCLIVVLLALWAIWSLWVLPALRQRCAPKFLGHFYLFPQSGQPGEMNDKNEDDQENGGRDHGPNGAGHETSMSTADPYVGAPFLGGNAPSGNATNVARRNKPATEDDTDDEPELPPPQPEPAMAHAVTSSGARLTIDTTDMDMHDIGCLVSRECLQQHVRIFGLYGTPANTQVFVPRTDNIMWDSYGSSQDAQPHTVAVFAQAKPNWMCALCRCV